MKEQILSNKSRSLTVLLHGKKYMQKSSPINCACQVKMKLQENVTFLSSIFELEDYI
jgi:hypothetical protein